VKKVAAILLLMMLTLLTVGLIMLFSTSAVHAKERYGDAYYLLKRQLAWMALGGLACAVAAAVPYPRWRPYAPLLLAVAGVLLLVVLVPHVGIRVGGARRWLGFGGFRFQPSEFAKLALVLWLAHWLAKEKRRLDHFWRGFGVPVAVMAVTLGLVLVEPDFGTTALLGAVAVAVMFIAGVRLRYLVPTVAGGLAAFALLVYHSPVRAARLLAFLDLEKHKEGTGYQVYQAVLAFGSGGFSGVGLGNSLQKMFYLPEAHTDFILPIIGEELGLVGTLAILALFAVLVACGAAIALRAPDPFGQYFGMGLTLLLALQVLINVGVVTAWLPTKGLPLPFISYGGSNVFMNMIEVGLLISIYRHGTAEMLGAEQGFFARREAVATATPQQTLEGIQ
jgi:cell division protein FtsW